jgi:hypothetical protein
MPSGPGSEAGRGAEHPELQVEQLRHLVLQGSIRSYDGGAGGRASHRGGLSEGRRSMTQTSLQTRTYIWADHSLASAHLTLCGVLVAAAFSLHESLSAG